MRVFVVGTGRCGSVSFREACRFITNYASGHETFCGLREYPDNFIEVNPHLRFSIANVAAKYPEAKWVHLVREPRACIGSLARLDGGKVMEAYRTLHQSVIRSGYLADTAFSYYWDVVDTIDTLLSVLVHPARRTVMRLESIQQEWPQFWAWIEAEGDYAASLTSWETPRNTQEERERVLRGRNSN